MKRRQLIIINDNGMILDNDDPPIKTVKLKDGTIIKLTIPTVERNLPDQQTSAAFVNMDVRKRKIPVENVDESACLYCR